MTTRPIVRKGLVRPGTTVGAFLLRSTTHGCESSLGSSYSDTRSSVFGLWLVRKSAQIAIRCVGMWVGVERGTGTERSFARELSQRPG